MKSKTVFSIFSTIWAVTAIVGTVTNAQGQKKEEPKAKLNQSMVMQEWVCEAPECPYSPWKFTDEEETILAHLMMAEAEGEGDIGMMLVVDVVLNRVESEEFPNTIEEVVYQPGQFQPVEDGRLWEVEPTDICYEILADIQTEYYGLSDALYFCENNHNKWHETNEELFTYRNHTFYR